jgi:hypothetical protein
LSPTTAWRLCALAGLATLLASTAFGWIPDLKPCGDTGGTGAVMAFELARTPHDLIALFFGETGRACTDRLEAAQVRALWLDSLAFIPSYAAFLALGGLALRPAGARLARAAMIAVLAAALFDQAEGAILSQLVSSPESPPDLFGPLFWAVRAKFALLGLGEILLALLLLRTTWLGRVAAIPLAAGGLVSLRFLFTAPRDPLMMAGHRWAWTALLAVAILAAIRPTLVRRAIPA